MLSDGELINPETVVSPSILYVRRIYVHLNLLSLHIRNMRLSLVGVVKGVIALTHVQTHALTIKLGVGGLGSVESGFRSKDKTPRR